MRGRPIIDWRAVLRYKKEIQKSCFQNSLVLGPQLMFNDRYFQQVYRPSVSKKPGTCIWGHDFPKKVHGCSEVALLTLQFKSFKCPQSAAASFIATADSWYNSHTRACSVRSYVYQRMSHRHTSWIAMRWQWQIRWEQTPHFGPAHLLRHFFISP
jgi:hypothetical protein